MCCRICINKEQGHSGYITRPHWVHPIAHRLVEGFPKTQDQHKCYTFMNEMSKEYNRQLHEAVNKLRVELPNAALTYVDLNTPMYELLTAYTKLGIQRYL
ncbi:GDSL esterase/lipase At5g14450-like [Camellia sinensis]|uniref:GDSL esterase/lipase At5g14450-like n=1 Tax=Camellia sinensis TaxID=4442 RepID=UPI00103692E3|nr:GDSL esterase/lipase At5g14450-like [Camellia sinensis]